MSIDSQRIGWCYRLQLLRRLLRFLPATGPDQCSMTAKLWFKLCCDVRPGTKRNAKRHVGLNLCLVHSLAHRSFCRKGLLRSCTNDSSTQICSALTDTCRCQVSLELAHAGVRFEKSPDRATVSGTLVGVDANVADVFVVVCVCVF